MKTEESRDIALQFCQLISTRSFAKMKDMTTNDATWFVNGHPDRVSYAGEFRFDDILPAMKAFTGSLDSFSFTVTGTTAEGERVAIEAVSHGTKDGRAYDNVYMMQYVINNGKVRSLREFFDHTSVMDFFYPNGAG